MDRTRHPSRSETLPPLDFSLASPGYYTGGNPDLSEEATVVTHYHLNQVQEELMYVIEQNGLTGDHSDTTQLHAAILAMVNAVTPPGVVVPYAGSSAPTGYLLCGGQEVSRAVYADLFGIIGTTYGNGDGGTTFNVPDLRNRTVAGVDNMAGAGHTNRLSTSGFGQTGDDLGQAGGSETHVLVNDELPQHSHNAGSLATNSTGSHTHSNGTLTAASAGSHRHEIRMRAGDAGVPEWRSPDLSSPQRKYSDPVSEVPNATQDGFSDFDGDHTHNITGNTSSAGSHSHSLSGSTAAVGTDTPHVNVQPTMVMNYIIKT